MSDIYVRFESTNQNSNLPVRLLAIDFFRAVERGQSKAAITNKQTKTGAMSNFGLLVIRSKFDVFRKILVLTSNMISNSIKILKSQYPTCNSIQFVPNL